MAALDPDLECVSVGGNQTAWRAGGTLRLHGSQDLLCHAPGRSRGAGALVVKLTRILLLEIVSGDRSRDSSRGSPRDAMTNDKRLSATPRISSHHAPSRRAAAFHPSAKRPPVMAA